MFLSVFTTIVLVRYGHSGWAWGFAVGAGVSLMSLFSLGYMVPRLTLPNAPAASQFLLALILFLKLPLYTVVLDCVMHKPGVDVRSIFPGILIAPIGITAKTVGAMVWQAADEAVYRRQVRRGGTVVRASRRERVGLRRRALAEPVSEQG